MPKYPEIKWHDICNSFSNRLKKKKKKVYVWKERQRAREIKCDRMLAVANSKRRARECSLCYCLNFSDVIKFLK